MVHSFARAIDDLSRELGLRIATPEYEILVVLMTADSMTAEELAEASTLSRSGFFHAIDRLKHRQFVTCEPDENDRRRKVYRLAPKTAAMLLDNVRRFDERHAKIPELALRGEPEAAQGAGSSDCPACQEARDGGHLSERPERLPNLTCEYQILLFLYLRPGADNGTIARAIACSATRFHTAIVHLISRGLVVREEDTEDKRRRRYHVTERVRRAIRTSHEKVKAWVDSLEREVDRRKESAA